MIKVVESTEVLEIHTTVDTWVRVLIFLFSLFPLNASYDIIIRFTWLGLPSVLDVIFAIVLVLTLVLTGMLMFTAIAGLNTRLCFNKTEQTMTYSSGAPVIRWRTTRYPIKNIIELQMKVHDWGEGWPSYSLLVFMTDGRKCESGSSNSQQEIQSIVQRVSSFLK